MRWLLCVLGLLVAAPAQAEWWEAKTDHFIVYSQSPAQDAKMFAEKLERFDMALRSLQNIKFSSATSDAHRLTVFRTGDIDDIGRLAGRSGVAGFYIPRAGGSVAFTPVKVGNINKGALLTKRRDRRTDLDPQSVLFHEYGHHFMFQHFSAAYPSWYVEGFAETVATLDLKPDGSFHVGNAPQYRGESFGDINVSLNRMLTSKNKPTAEDYYSHYTIGWLLNHYLTFEPSRQGQLKQYLQMINAGTDHAEAARRAFGDLNRLDREIHRYRTGQLLGADVRPANYAPPRVTMRKLTEGEEAIMRVKMRSKRGVSRKTAGDVARDARAIAARYPNSFPVQLGLSEAELDLAEFEPGRLAQAEAAIDRALALNRNSVEAMIHKGRVHLERGKLDKSELPTARSWFAKAHQADSAHPAVLFYNYLTYYHSGQPIPEPALIGLERAYEMALFDPEVRVVLARQLLAENNGDLARSVLLPLAISPHESKVGKKMDQIVDLIEAQQVGEAYTQLAAELAEQERKRKAGEDD